MKKQAVFNKVFHSGLLWCRFSCWYLRCYHIKFFGRSVFYTFEKLLPLKSPRTNKFHVQTTILIPVRLPYCVIKMNQVQLTANSKNSRQIFLPWRLTFYFICCTIIKRVYSRPFFNRVVTSHITARSFLFLSRYCLPAIKKCFGRQWILNRLDKRDDSDQENKTGQNQFQCSALYREPGSAAVCLKQ